MNVKMYGLAAAAIALVATGWFARDWKEGAEDAARLQAEQAAQERIDQAIARIAEETASQIAGIRVENKTIVQEVRREVFKEPVYSECFITADGLRLINKARAQSGSGADDTVSATGTAATD